MRMTHWDGCHSRPRTIQPPYCRPRTTALILQYYRCEHSYRTRSRFGFFDTPTLSSQSRALWNWHLSSAVMHLPMEVSHTDRLSNDSTIIVQTQRHPHNEHSCAKSVLLKANTTPSMHPAPSLSQYTQPSHQTHPKAAPCFHVLPLLASYSTSGGPMSSVIRDSQSSSYRSVFLAWMQYTRLLAC